MLRAQTIIETHKTSNSSCARFFIGSSRERKFCHLEGGGEEKNKKAKNREKRREGEGGEREERRREKEEKEKKEKKEKKRRRRRKEKREGREERERERERERGEEKKEKKGRRGEEEGESRPDDKRGLETFQLPWLNNTQGVENLLSCDLRERRGSISPSNLKCGILFLLFAVLYATRAPTP